eukprot:CAMPEP_0118900760 /NCGR_PEP_ID=MMETSP1166-20130328/6738_1 /TAXON_ID=1104430 /ORGANISM="Chrysoreinhardia sp, Strain CCMP3193" /LENGTH=399 /DNA_ID=CAMNT_0006839907 /DNA_START=24 /DNA_END=1226 /DNA_ORIENTATION=-
MRWLFFYVFFVGRQTTALVDTLVLGGGFAGTYTALQVRRLRPGTSVTVVDERERFAFLPLLYEYACGVASLDEVSTPFSAFDFDFVRGTVDSFDPATRTATLANGDTLTGKTVVLALGKESICPAGASPFYRLEDAEALRGNLPDTCVVVGGGFTGVELACHLKAENAKRNVTLVHRSARLVPSAAEHNRAAAVAALNTLGVHVRLGVGTGTTPEDLAADSDDSEDTTTTAKVIWTAGARPAKPLRELPAVHKSSKGKDLLAVDAALRLRLAPGDVDRNVFALGDAARLPGGGDAQSSAQVALQQALVAARNVAAYLDDRPAVPFKYVPLGELVALGPRDGTASLLGAGLNLDGAVAGLARRLVYAARMPTPAQRLTSLSGLASKKYLSSSSSSSSSSK